jgi:acetyl-CoA C-acetyltransferase
MATQPQDPIVILSYARTPMGGFQGQLAGTPATELGAAAVRAAVERAGIASEQVDKIFMGCVLPAGLGQAPARQAALGAGLPRSVEATTINKVCGSGMQAAMFAHDMIASGSADLIVAGGMESMSNSPYLMKKHRAGARIGHDTVYDHMMLDGLEDAYDAGRAMGTFAEDSAREYQFTRAIRTNTPSSPCAAPTPRSSPAPSTARPRPSPVKTRKGEEVVSIDEQPGKANPSASPASSPPSPRTAPSPPPTPAASPTAPPPLVITRQSVADRLGVKPVARIVAHAAQAQAPNLFTTAPVPAVRKALEKAGWDIGDVDLWEVNEAFACVAMIAMRDLGISRDQLNVHGGATALGHPIGASGARILATLLSALETHGQKRGLATLCIGGGEATAMAVELLA